MIECKCGICGVVVDQRTITPFDYIYSCDEHRLYAQCPQPDVIKKRLGLISEYSDHMKSCSICKEKLTAEELNSISELDFLITCNMHREVKYWHQIDGAKLWFQFKASVDVSAKYDDPEDMQKFIEWRKQNNK